MMHREIRVLEKAFDIFASGEEANADTRCNNDLVFADADRLRDRSQHLLTHLVGVLAGAKIGQQDNKLVSAHSTDGIGFANAGFKPARNLAEHSVSGLMAERVVDA